MNRSKTNRWLCVFGTVISVMIAYSISIQNEGHDATNMELPIGASMGPDLMTRNGEQSFSQLQQLIEGTIETDAWRLTGSSSMKPHRTIESVLTNGEGCKTFTYDGDGNLLPDVERHYDSTELTNN